MFTIFRLEARVLEAEKLLMGKGAKISVNAKVKKRIPYEMQLLPFGFPIVLWEYD